MQRDFFSFAKIFNKFQEFFTVVFHDRQVYPYRHSMDVIRINRFADVASVDVRDSKQVVELVNEIAETVSGQSNFESDMAIRQNYAFSVSMSHL
jgi:hypothetical protein